MPSKEPLERALAKSTRDIMRLEVELALRKEDLAKVEAEAADFAAFEAAQAALRKAEFALKTEKRRQAELRQRLHDERSEAARARILVGFERAIAAGLRRAALHKELAAATYDYLAGIDEMMVAGDQRAPSRFPMLPPFVIPMAHANGASFGRVQPTDTSAEQFEFGLLELKRKGIQL